MIQATAPSTEQRDFSRGFLRGMKWAVVHVFLGGFIAASLIGAPKQVSAFGFYVFMSVAFIGVTQLVYLLPWSLRLKRLGRLQELRGHIFIGSIVFVLDAVLVFCIKVLHC